MPFLQASETSRGTACRSAPMLARSLSSRRCGSSVRAATRVLSSWSPNCCPPTSRWEAAKRGERLGLKKLNELPAADAYKAVLREVDGCNAPIIVEYGLGR